MFLEFEGLKIKISDEVYKPSEDTFLLIRNLKVRDDDEVLEVGCGCGIISLVAAKRASRVVAVDVNPFAVCLAWENVRLNGLEGKVEVRLGNLFQPIKQNEKFNLIIFNPPFFPGKPKNVVESAWIDEDGEIIYSLGIVKKVRKEDYVEQFSRIMANIGLGRLVKLYFPLYFGSLFSKNAFIPSFLSSVAKQLLNASIS